jgi:hypothetical protein
MGTVRHSELALSLLWVGESELKERRSPMRVLPPATLISSSFSENYDTKAL